MILLFPYPSLESLTHTWPLGSLRIPYVHRIPIEPTRVSRWLSLSPTMTTAVVAGGRNGLWAGGVSVSGGQGRWKKNEELRRDVTKLTHFLWTVRSLTSAYGSYWKLQLLYQVLKRSNFSLLRPQILPATRKWKPPFIYLPVPQREQL